MIIFMVIKIHWKINCFMHIKDWMEINLVQIDVLESHGVFHICDYVTRR